MRITQEADNALSVVLYLAMQQAESRSTARVISESTGISMQFTLKILNKLTRQGITQAVRGIYGGYSLARDSADITLGDVITSIDGPITLNRCLGDESHCVRELVGHCVVRNALSQIQQDVVEKLGAITIAQLVEERDCNLQAQLAQQEKR